MHPFQVRIGDGVLAQPTFAGSTNGGRGEDFETATATVTATEIEETISNVSSR